MILPEDIPKYKGGKPLYYPDNMCTYEHKYTRTQKKKRSRNKQNGILCRKCNGEVGAIQEAMMSKEEIWARSGREPKL